MIINMCGVCGCGSDVQGLKVVLFFEKGYDYYYYEYIYGYDYYYYGYDYYYDYGYYYYYGYDYSYDYGRQVVVELEQNILYCNQLLVECNWGYFVVKNMLVINLVSFFGLGKIFVLECILCEMKDCIDFYVIEGDQ